QHQYHRQHREERLGVVHVPRVATVIEQAGVRGAAPGQDQLVQQPDPAAEEGQDDEGDFEPAHLCSFGAGNGESGMGNRKNGTRDLARKPLTIPYSRFPATCPAATPPGRPPAESPRGRPASSASCLPSVSPAASSCAKRRHHSTWPARSCASP